MPDIFDKKITYAEYASDYLNEGWHEVTVHQFEFDQTKIEKPFVRVSFRDANGKGHREKFYLTKAAMWRWTKFIVCCGIKESQVLSARETTRLIQGKKVRINIISETGTDGNNYKKMHKTGFEPMQNESDLPYEDFQGDNPGQIPEQQIDQAPVDGYPDDDPF